MTPQSHDDLVRQTATGDDAALTELLERHLPVLRAYVRLHADPLLRQRESTSDLVQSVCREVLRDLAGFEYRGEAAFRAWLCKRAMSKIRDRRKYHLAQRRDARREEVAPDPRSARADYASVLSPSQQAIGLEEMERLERCFDELPADYREAIVLSRIVGLGVADVAARMGRSEGSVRGLVNRAMTRLSWLMTRQT